jgi:hypothetical protein
MIQTKNEYNRNFELNRVNVRYSDYQNIILSSVFLSKQIQNIELKNKIYSLFKKNTNKDLILSLDTAFSKILNNDKYFITDALEEFVHIQQSSNRFVAKKMPGVVAVWSNDYR